MSGPNTSEKARNVVYMHLMEMVIDKQTKANGDPVNLRSRSEFNEAIKTVRASTFSCFCFSFCFYVWNIYKNSLLFKHVLSLIFFENFETYFGNMKLVLFFVLAVFLVDAVHHVPYRKLHTNSAKGMLPTPH